MVDIHSFVRKSITRLEPYQSARDEFKGTEGVFLDANENPFGHLNRYPDPYQSALKVKLASIKGLSPECIFIGNGSDEIIDLCYRVFCAPGADKVIICPPTYGMYEVSAGINDVAVESIPLDCNFQPNISAILSQKAKLLFLCSPNNPTGNSLTGIQTILKQFNGIVCVDEAYIDFSTQQSYIEFIHEYPNLIVLQTLSKAWGLAAIRLGIAYANPEVIRWFNRVKPPYNVSALNQTAALEALSNPNAMRDQVAILLEQREWLTQELLKISFVINVFPSDANFLLIKTTGATALYDALIAKGIVIRNRHTVVENCIRITVGTQTENQALIQALQQIENEKNTLY